MAGKGKISRKRYANKLDEGKNALKISILPNEIIFPDSKIEVEAFTPLNAEYAQDAITTHGLRGQVQLSNRDRKAIGSPSIVSLQVITYWL